MSHWLCLDQVLTHDRAGRMILDQQPLSRDTRNYGGPTSRRVKGSSRLELAMFNNKRWAVRRSSLNRVTGRIKTRRKTRAATRRRRRQGATRRRRPPVLTRALFRRWQAGDESAKEELWSLLQPILLPLAVKFCSYYADPSTARQWGTTAFGNAYLETQQRKAELRWQGAPALLAFVRNLVIHRCQDECRRFWRELGRMIDVETPAGEDCPCLLESIPAATDSPEDDLRRREDGRGGLLRLIQRLAALREACRGKPSLIPVVEEMQEYLRQSLTEAVPPGIDVSNSTLDELAAAAVPGRVDATKSELYAQIRRRLRLARGTFDQRMKRIHALLK